MRCGYHEAGRCRSCTQLRVPYPDQVRAKQDRAEQALAAAGPIGWLEAATGPEQGFRNKAKLVVGGRPGRPTLGILDGHGRGVDLRRCGLYERPLADALEPLAGFVADLGLLPYDIRERTGELKYLIVTAAPDGRLMVRFVLRSTTHLTRIRRSLGRLRQVLPHLAVVSANLHPEHKAVLEGDTEVVLTRAGHLPFPLPGVTLQLSPRSFFQTNTAMAVQLYAQARDWVDEAVPAGLWDLYCGVGGFALHVAAPGRRVTGFELTPEAITAARRAARQLPPGIARSIRFEAADATGDATTGPAPELVIVNPPRRGLGAGLCSRLEASRTRHLLYSSCNLETLARDLTAMPSLRPVRARVFDMFPHTAHQEVLVQLERS